MCPTKKLRDLDPRLKANVLVFDCPCDRCADIRAFPDAERNKLFCDGRIRVPIKPQANGWDHVSGEFPDTISLIPSIRIGHGGRGVGGCEGWHGYLTNGELVAC